MANSSNKVDRLRQKEELFFKLGVLFGPLLHLNSHQEMYSESTAVSAAAACRLMDEGKAGNGYDRIFGLILGEMIMVIS